MSRGHDNSVAERLRLVLMQAKASYLAGEYGLGEYWAHYHDQVQRDLRQAPKHLSEKERVALYQVWMLQLGVITAQKTQPNEFPLFLEAYRGVVTKLTSVHDKARPLGLLLYGFDAQHTLPNATFTWQEAQQGWVFWSYLDKFGGPDGLFKRIAHFRTLAKDEWLCTRVAAILEILEYTHQCFLPWCTWFWGFVLLLLCHPQHHARVVAAVSQQLPPAVADQSLHFIVLADALRAVETVECVKEIITP